MEKNQHLPRAKTPKRNTALDGLRGVAVLVVFLYHHGLLNSGWVGVDLFFVLSGFLITGILRRTREDHYPWREFWIKRATRILPPFVLLLVATRLLRFGSTWLQQLGYLFSFGDVLAVQRPEFSTLLHLWSLAVEEHFYLVWPFAVMFLRRRTLMYALTVLILFEPLLRAAVTPHAPNWGFVYHLTPFRLDGICLGCLLALAMEAPLHRQRIRQASAYGLAASLTALLVCRLVLGVRFTRSDPTVAYNALVYWLVALAAFFIVGYIITRERSLMSRALTFPPLVFLGTISYGLYLYQPLVRDAIARSTHEYGTRAILLDTPVVLLAGWLSFRFLEKPLIEWGKRKANSLRNASEQQAVSVTTAP